MPYPRLCECGEKVVNINQHRQSKKHIQRMELKDKMKDNEEYVEKLVKDTY